MTLEFYGQEKVLYDCRVQLEPTALNFSETNLYVTETRLVFELENPLAVEISEITELSMSNYYGERFIYIKYKDIKGINSLSFVCTGFAGIISNISKTVFVYKLINRLREGMDPRDMHLLMSGSTAELYAPWILLTIILTAPLMSVLLPVDCWMRLALGFVLLASFGIFSFTEVYKLLLGRLRWPVFALVSAIILLTLIYLWNACATREVAYSAVVYGRYIKGDLDVPETVWFCVDVKSDLGRDELCVARDDWTQYRVGDRIIVYYMKGPISSSLIPMKYGDRTRDYVKKHRIHI